MTHPALRRQLSAPARDTLCDVLTGKRAVLVDGDVASDLTLAGGESSGVLRAEVALLMAVMSVGQRSIRCWPI